MDCYAQPEFCITHLGGVIYQNRPPDYFNTFLDKRNSWDAVAGRLAQAKAFVNLGQQTVPESEVVKLIHLSKHKESILVCSVRRRKVLEVSIEGLCCRGQKIELKGQIYFL